MHLLPVDDVITAPAGRPILVGEASRAAVTIAPDATMRAAADRMREHDTDRLVVVEDADHVIGVVTGNDLLRTITRRGNLLRKVVEQQVAALNGVTEVDGLLSVLPDADAGWTPVQAPSTTES
jgi:CBS domain-containing protein